MAGVQNQPDPAAQEGQPPAPLAALRGDLEALNALSENYCIYRVPPRMRGDGSLYTPKNVSIGPIHHGGEGLEVMEEYKKRFLRDFLQRLRNRRPAVTFDVYAEFIRNREPELRGCYTDKLHYTTDKLISIFMVDAAFLVELLLRNDAPPPPVTATTCRIFGKPRMLVDIVGDLILLENQLPISILFAIFQEWFPAPNGDQRDVIKLIFRLLELKQDVGVTRVDINNIQRVRGSNPVHILDCLRKYHIPVDMEALGDREIWWRPVAGPPNPNCIVGCLRRCNILDDPRENRRPGSQRRLEKVENPYIPSANELHQAGLKFTPSRDGLFSINFVNGVLMVPHMQIGTTSEAMYRNLLAHEQCHYRARERIFTDYFCLMDKLVNTSQDIDLLVKNGIVMLTMGDSGAAANVLNRMTQGLKTSDQMYFSGIYRELNVFYETCSCTKWKADLEQRYCYSPCATASVIAAGFLLAFTIVQMSYTIARYHIHKS